MSRLSQVFVPREREFFDLFEEAGSNILRRGEDARKGTVLLPRGTRMSAQGIGVCAAAGEMRANRSKKMLLRKRVWCLIVDASELNGLTFPLVCA